MPPPQLTPSRTPIVLTNRPLDAADPLRTDAAPAPAGEPRAPHHAPGVSFVVIGRNEAPRIVACLESVRAQQIAGQHELLYVDSGSSDGSAALAAAVQDVRVLRLDDPLPTAAKARNVGWRAARHDLVQFVDGDAELVAGWTATAIAALAADASVGAVYGSFREKHPERSLYNRLADMDWPHVPGSVDAFGGIVMVRRSLLVRTGGFPEDVRVGEEPILAARIRALGLRIEQLPAAMAVHDIDTRTFGQYWRRGIATGWAYALRARHRAPGETFWRSRHAKTLLLATLAGSALLLGVLVSPLILAAAALLALLDVARIAWRERRRARSTWFAIVYALHVRLVVVPMALGWLRWRLQRGPRRQRQHRAPHLDQPREERAEEHRQHGRQQTPPPRREEEART